MGTPGCSLRSIIILAPSSASSTVALNTKPTGWKVAILSAGRGVAKLAGPLAMAYSEPSIRPKISQIIWLWYFCSAARIALMDIATPASTPNPSVHSPGNTASCRPIRLMLLESSGTLPKKILELYPV